MKTNTATKRTPVTTHEGGKALRVNAEKELRRSVMACLLWENSFYESGVDISQRIIDLIPKVDPAKVAQMAIEAREQMKLRHVPLFLVNGMSYHKTHLPYVEETLVKVIQRADELTEFLAIYWKDGKHPLAASIKRGLARAFANFDEYALAKYDRDGAIKLRDILRLVHPIPKDEVQASLWKRVVSGELQTPDTWEVELSRNDGVEKKDKWTRLLVENKLGALALLRNLRNMEQAGVDRSLIQRAIREMSVYRVLPFRFIAAARHVPHLENVLEEKFIECSSENKLSGKTVILVDVSGSMDAEISSKSDMKRIDAACGVAMVGREMCDDVEVYTFSNNLVAVPNRRGFSLRDAVIKSQGHGGTYLRGAIERLNGLTKYDRLIVITDEQSHDGNGQPEGRGYLLNVASYQNGVGYGKWTTISGFSESVFRYIVEIEKEL